MYDLRVCGLLWTWPAYVTILTKHHQETEFFVRKFETIGSKHWNTTSSRLIDFASFSPPKIFLAAHIILN